MRGKARFCVATFLVAVILSPICVNAEPPAVRVPKVDVPPKIDGRLDDTAWQQAEKLTAFHVFGTGADPAVPTEAWLATDGRFLYVGIRCHDPQLASLTRNVAVRDQGVNSDDSIEFFLDPGTGGTTYFHFLLNADNVQGDKIIVQGNADIDWNCPWNSATFLDPVLLPAEGWSAEMAFPMYEFRRRQGREPWRVNIGRNKRTAPGQFITWAPVKKSLHAPDKFGIALGLQEARPGSGFLPLLNNVQAHPYQVTEQGYAYQVTGLLANEGGQRGEVEVVIADQPDQGAGSEAKTTVTLAPVAQSEFSVQALIVRPGPRTLSVNLRNPQTGEEMQRVDVDTRTALNPLDAYAGQTYYTSQEHARILAPVNMPAAALAGSALVVRARMLDGEKEIAAAEATATSAAAIELPIKPLPVGEYPVEVSLLDGQGTLVGQARTTIVKRRPAPAGVTEVKIDQESRSLMLNGKPFFPIGICATHMGEADFQLYQEMGYNTLIRWQGIGRNHPYQHAIDTLDMARRYGIYIIEAPLSFLQDRPNHQGLLKNPAMLKAALDIPPFIETVRNHPAVLAYYSLDEAPAGGLDEGLIAVRKAINETDPYHPVYISGGSCVGKARYDFAEILGEHIYWCPLSVGSTSPNTVARALKKTYLNVTEPNRRPLLFVPQNEITSHSRRPLSPAERKVTVYLAVIHGAKSVIYFASPVRLRATVGSMKEISRELNAMAPAVLNRTPPQEIVVEPATIDTMPVVQAVLKDRPEGGALLIAANSNVKPVHARWDLSDLGHVRVSNFHTGQRYQAQEGVFEEDLEAYETRAYLVEGGKRNAGENAVVRVALSGPAVEPEPAKPSAAASLNVLKNADFQQSASGWTISRTGDVTFPDEAPDGDRCLKIAAANSGLQVAVPALKLKPNTPYRFGGWIRSRLAQGKTCGGFYVYESSEGLRLGLPVAPTDDGWRMVERVLRTPDRPVTVLFRYALPADVQGEIWLDKLFLQEIPEVAGPKNLLLNSSFEVSSVAGWPDSWWLWGTGGGDSKLIGDDGYTGTTDETAFDGKYSTRMVVDGRGAEINYKHQFASTGLRGGILVEQDKPYTFSIYMKAADEGVPVDVTICNFAFNSPQRDEGPTETFRLTKEWKRYSVTMTYPREGWFRGIRPDVTIIIRSPGRDLSTIWLDAAQFEQGTQSTDYETDHYIPVLPPPGSADALDRVSPPWECFWSASCRAWSNTFRQ